ncbi:hypothetical protein [Saliphagus infecundisoli]|uniref:Uncharacterized protein n=1 Tax=Saliphagus infecundisoli TaxID=1849069 RepID=A0ABD5QHZ9_9EURY|nr:hypothetical protein [Saliphagus infecundisoli]
MGEEDRLATVWTGTFLLASQLGAFAVPTGTGRVVAGLVDRDGLERALDVTKGGSLPVIEVKNAIRSVGLKGDQCAVGLACAILGRGGLWVVGGGWLVGVR